MIACRRRTTFERRDPRPAWHRRFWYESAGSADLGKLLLMFFAGLEIDLARFRQAQRKTMTFGLMTTMLPLGLGTTVSSSSATER
jgi:hypothetical protein